MKTYTVKEVAKMLDTNPETVRRWIRSGKLKSYKDSRKEGNVITEQMLKDFVKKSPKYAALVPALVTSAIVPGLGAASVLVSALSLGLMSSVEEKKKRNSEVVDLIKSEIKKRQEDIRYREEQIARLRSEIEDYEESIQSLEEVLEGFRGEKESILDETNEDD